MTEIKKPVAGLVGLGSLGQHHLRVLVSLLGAGNVIACDSSPDRLAKFTKQYGVRGVDDYRSLGDTVDAVSIVTPTETHAAVGSFFLERGIHSFIEKPIAPSVDDAKNLIALAEKNSAVLQVGHIERFNPAVMHAAGFVRNPIFIEAQRLAPYDARVAATDVVLDLMIHDIDIVLSFISAPLVSVEATGARIFSDRHDIVKARLRFEGGCVADMSASRVSLERFRKIRIFQSDAYISLDYMRQDLKVVRRKGDKVRSMEDLEVLFPKLGSGEPLLLELSDFISCVTGNRRPRVSGAEALKALSAAMEIKSRLQAG